jgi:hypothetical protein
MNHKINHDDIAHPKLNQSNWYWSNQTKYNPNR